MIPIVRTDQLVHGISVSAIINKVLINDMKLAVSSDTAWLCQNKFNNVDLKTIPANMFQGYKGACLLYTVNDMDSFHEQLSKNSISELVELSEEDLDIISRIPTPIIIEEPQPCVENMATEKTQENIINPIISEPGSSVETPILEQHDAPPSEVVQTIDVDSVTINGVRYSQTHIDDNSLSQCRNKKANLLEEIQEIDKKLETWERINSRGWSI